MGLLDTLKFLIKPRRVQDPDFGSLLFVGPGSGAKEPYWSGEWTFPPTGKKVAINLEGGEDGPRPEARAFYLSLPDRFGAVVDLA